MKRPLVTILILTLLSIGYVFQHAKTLEHSYQINSCKKNLSLLIDRNRALRYNIAKLEAPARLEKAITAKTQAEEIYMPLTYYKLNIEKMPEPYMQPAPTGPFISAGRIFLSMFSLDAKAVAGDLND